MGCKECVIGLWNNYDNTELVTFSELQELVAENQKLYNYKIETWGKAIVTKGAVKKPYELKDYLDFRKSTNLTRFDFCPYCGNKIDWKGLKRI